jgi:dTMP kinase
MADRGKLVIIEGPDGSGKGEQARRLQARLVGRVPHGSTLTTEPTDGPIGRLIRQALRHDVTLAPRAMGALYAADRLDHVATCIEPALARGAVVVCDRFELSNRVYRAAEQPVRRCKRCSWETWTEEFIVFCQACGCGLLSWPRADALNYARALSRGIMRPDVTIVLMAPLAVCAARRRARGGVDELYDGGELQARVHALYARAAELLPGERVAMVDADAEPEVVEARVWSVVEEVVGG